jgi:hypothetical protein
VATVDDHGQDATARKKSKVRAAANTTVTDQQAVVLGAVVNTEAKLTQEKHKKKKKHHSSSSVGLPLTRIEKPPGLSNLVGRFHCIAFLLLVCFQSMNERLTGCWCGLL